MKHTPHPVFSASALLLAFSALPVSAATTVLFSENFNSISDNAALNTAGWYYRHGSNSTSYPAGPVAYSSGSMTGNVWRGGTGSSVNSWVLTQWEGTSLTNVGDTLSVSFDMSFGAPARFNVSFFNANGATITANSYSTGGLAGGSASVIAGSTGYGYQQDFTSGVLTGSGVVTTTAASNGIDPVVFRSSATPTLTGSVINLTFSVKRVDTGAQVSLLSGATVLDQWTDTSVSGSVSFDTLKFWIGTTNSSTVNRALDNVVVSYTSAVPEPSSAAALAGVATLGLVATRRRRK